MLFQAVLFPTPGSLLLLGTFSHVLIPFRALSFAASLAQAAENHPRPAGTQHSSNIPVQELVLEQGICMAAGWGFDLPISLLQNILK